MDIQIHLTTERIPDHLPVCPAGKAGAWVEFRGVVRAEEGEKRISALEYEAYSPMAETEMRRILTNVAAGAPCLSAQVIHRIGVVPVDETAIYVGIGAPHRAEAFALIAAFLDALKKDVPIWKIRALPCPAEMTAGGVPGTGAARPGPSSSSQLSNLAKSPGEVIALLQACCSPLDTEAFPLAQASGRVLREAVVADEDQPAFDRSSVDGYAVRLDDPSTQLRLVDEIRAGDWKPRSLDLGETVRIATGGALPGEGLQIVMREDVRVEGDSVTILQRANDRNIRFRGEDACSGRVLVEAGAVLEPGALALLASVGCANPVVTRLPRVLHVVTGNELVAPCQKPGRGQIRDSNSTLVRAFLEKWRVLPRQLKVGEDESEVEAALGGPLPVDEVDLLLISGGASVGQHDFTRPILERRGFRILVGKTTTRPGKPLIVAQRGRTLAFGLPGNPLAHWVCLNLYVRVALARFAGLSSALPIFRTGFLADELRANANARETFWPASWHLQNGQVMLRPLRWISSGDLTSLARANALIHVSSGTNSLEKGRRVEFVSTS